MKRWQAALTLSAALLTVACTNLENPTDPTAARLVVHSVLDTRFDRIVVLLARAQTGMPRSIDGIGDDEPVLHATVTITAPNGTAMPARNEITDSSSYAPGVYALNPSDFGVRLADGGTYGLHVRTDVGEEVTGTTTIPSAPARQILPARLFYRQSDTLRLSWPSVPGARSYELVVGYQTDVDYRLFTNTSVAIAGTALTIAGDEVFRPFGPVQFSVQAVDVNYYDYYRMQSDPFAGAAPSHLQGAIGVFGSVAPILFGELNVR